MSDVSAEVAVALRPPALAVGGPARQVEARVRARLVAIRSLALAADLLDAAGLGLVPGDWVITGSQTQIRVGAGDRVAAEIDGLGRVAVSIA